MRTNCAPKESLMLKKNNSSKKNGKNAKSTKNSRTKYKIESLEPRLMMDAEIPELAQPDLDLQQFDSYTEQFQTLSSTMGDKAGDSLGQFDKIDFSQFQLADKANAAVLNIFLQFITIPAIREGRWD